MWFWISVAGVLFVLWVLTRIFDRRHRGGIISRRVGSAESAAARGQVAAEQHRAAHQDYHGQGGPFG